MQIPDAILKLKGKKVYVRGDINLQDGAGPTQRGTALINFLLAGAGVETDFPYKSSGPKTADILVIGEMIVAPLPASPDTYQAKRHQRQESDRKYFEEHRQGWTEKAVARGETVVQGKQIVEFFGLKDLPPADLARFDKWYAEDSVHRTLSHRLPEVKFDAVGLSDTLDFFHDVMILPLAVDWTALEAAGVTRQSPVSCNATETATGAVLQSTLDSLKGKEKISFSVDANGITISTVEGLKAKAARPPAKTRE